jgi:hypothetical protein
MPEFVAMPRHYLNLHYTLSCGQAFRWRHDRDGYWAAPVKGRVIRIKEADEGFFWETAPGEPDWQLVSETFRFEADIERIYDDLSASDDRVARLVREVYPGLRLLRQDPTEMLDRELGATHNEGYRSTLGAIRKVYRGGRWEGASCVPGA